MIKLKEEQLDIVVGIIKKYAPGIEARVFGSRHRGGEKKHSDLDIVIVGKEKIDERVLDDIRDDFAESDLPFRVDVLDWNAVSAEFQKVIEKGYETIIKP
jgi:predicted nucleotidyltransferase